MLLLPNKTALPARVLPSKKFSLLKMLSFDGNPPTGISQPVWQAAELMGNILCISAKKHFSTVLTASICQRSRCFMKTNSSEGEESQNNRDLGVASGQPCCLQREGSQPCPHPASCRRDPNQMGKIWGWDSRIRFYSPTPRTSFL